MRASESSGHGEGRTLRLAQLAVVLSPGDEERSPVARQMRNGRGLARLLWALLHGRADASVIDNTVTQRLPHVVNTAIWEARFDDIIRQPKLRQQIAAQHHERSQMPASAVPAHVHPVGITAKTVDIVAQPLSGAQTIAQCLKAQPSPRRAQAVAD